MEIKTHLLPPATLSCTVILLLSTFTLCDPDVCQSPVSASTASANPSAELQCLIRVSTEKTQTAIELVKKKMETPTLPPRVAADLKVCEDSYNDALDNLAKATKAMDAQDMPTLNSMLSAALTNYDTCETGFAGMPGISPMAEEDETLSQLMRKSLEVYQLMKG